MNRMKTAAYAALAMTALTVNQAEAKQLFWDEPAAIKTMNLDGTGAETFLEGFAPEDLWVNGETGEVYWWDEVRGTLYRTNRNGNDQTAILELGKPTGVTNSNVAVDTENGYLYWHCFDVMAGYVGTIKRVKLATGEIESFVEDVTSLGDIEIEDGRLFWTGSASGTIESIQLDGSDRQLIFNDPETLIAKLAMDRENNIIYFTEERNRQVMQVRYDGGELFTLFTHGDFCRANDFEYLNGRFFFSDGADRYNARLISTDLSGGDLQEKYRYFSETGKLCVGSDNRLYLTDPDKQSIISMDVHGGRVDYNFQGDRVLNAESFVIDKTTKSLYIGNGDERISKTDLKGSPALPITDKQDEAILGIATYNGKLFWADEYESVFKADLDGSNIEALPYTINEPTFIHADEIEGYLYLATSESQVERIDPDGIEAPDTLFETDSYLRGVFAYPEIGRVFYTTSRGLFSRNMDGSDKQVVSDTLYDYHAMTIDKDADRVYWVSTASLYQNEAISIYSANLDGTEIQELYRIDNPDQRQEIHSLVFGVSEEKTAAEKIFAFSDASQWSTNSGTIEASANSTDNDGSLEVDPNGSATVSSELMNTADITTNPTTTLSMDLWVTGDPANQWWLGSVQLQIEIPSAGIWYSNAGTVQLTPLPKNAWSTVQFSVPQNVVNALNGNYSDMKMKFVFNTAAGSGPYRLDNMRFE